MVNLIGKSYETKHVVPTKRADGKLSRVNFSFQEVHVDAAKALAEVAKEAGVNRFIHVSASAANKSSASEWSRSKAFGEDAVRSVIPDAIIVKLNTVFGPEDRFLNLIAETTKRLPFFPLLNGGSNVVQPIYVADVGKGLHQLVQVVFHSKSLLLLARINSCLIFRTTTISRGPLSIFRALLTTRIKK